MRDADTFLTIAEIQRLTGRKYAPAQRRVLEKRKIPYDLDDFDRPVVLRAVIERRQLGKAEAPSTAWQPDFSAFPAVG